MGQRIYTKNFGPIEFDKTFVEGTLHLGRLVGGGFLHITGQPIDSEKELRAAIPRGPYLEEALNWFAHKDDAPDEDVKRNIVIKADGSYAFDDGSEIETITDLVQSIAPGPALDAAVMWFMGKTQAAKQHLTEVKASSKKPTGMITPPKKAPAKKPVVKKPIMTKPLPQPVTEASLATAAQEAQAITD